MADLLAEALRQKAEREAARQRKLAKKRRRQDAAGPAVVAAGPAVDAAGPAAVADVVAAAVGDVDDGDRRERRIRIAAAVAMTALPVALLVAAMIGLMPIMAAASGVLMTLGAYMLAGGPLYRAAVGALGLAAALRVYGRAASVLTVTWLLFSTIGSLTWATLVNGLLIYLLAEVLFMGFREEGGGTDATVRVTVRQ